MYQLHAMESSEQEYAEGNLFTRLRRLSKPVVDFGSWSGT